ncbi:MAG TPA: fluoride efflux transporter CrcB [Gemmatimonadales bacterium]|nr:fluoride efflux transporter CrcB [Anaeromyxobacteraceae bacterium]HTR20786.1 fluoride efflux transporter CrcB [Gemmatimonadales bacterium]
MRDVMWVALGAILGANLRFAVSRSVAKYVTASLPYGTLLVNATGSLLLGFVLVWTGERVLADPRWRMFMAVGFCGSYTTFSSYTFETFTLFEQGRLGLAAANFAANNLVCLLAVLVGAALARMI